MSTPHADRATLLEALLPVAREAGAAIMEVHRAGVANAAAKGDGSPVTEADLKANRIICAALADLAPEIAVVSEEEAASHAADGAALERFFLVDPLDGTKEFLKDDGKGAFTVNIALIENGAPVMGVVFAPALDRLFAGDVASGAFEINVHGLREKLQVRELSGTPVAVASASHRDAETDAWLGKHGITETVSIGSSLKFCLVAAGEADVYPRFGPTMEWDTAAGHAVLSSAGGDVVTPDGAAFVYAKPDFRNGAFIARGGFKG